MEDKVITSKISKELITKDFVIENKNKVMDLGTNIANEFNLKPIYFDTDKSNIRSDAANELAIVLSVLNKYPKLKIAIKTHTDSRATTEYNIKLSDRRAASIMNWLVKNGISKNRLTAKGYGESELVNKCADDIECTEEEHQANRRSEFIVTSMK
jgi:outer membrane protein OmpA-like peptidoglycan-associated protein